MGVSSFLRSLCVSLSVRSCCSIFFFFPSTLVSRVLALDRCVKPPGTKQGNVRRLIEFAAPPIPPGPIKQSARCHQNTQIGARRTLSPALFLSLALFRIPTPRYAIRRVCTSPATNRPRESVYNSTVRGSHGDPDLINIQTLLTF